MYDFYLNGKLINDLIIDFNYSEDLTDIATSFDFTSIMDFGLTSQNGSGKDVLNRIEVCEVGTNTPFYVGFITDWEHTTDRNIYRYSGFDVGFYLNKNQVVKQFRGVNIGSAIQLLCAENQVNLGSLPSFKQTIKKSIKVKLLAIF